MKKRNKKIRIKFAEADSETMGNLASHVAEFFPDYVVIGRVRDGLVWRFSDRTFAMGAIKRLAERLDSDDRMALEEFGNEPGR